MKKTTSILGLVVCCAAMAAPVGDIVPDGGFEEGAPNPFWEEFSKNFASPICNAERCGDFFGDAFEGDWWVWFGGPEESETGWVFQEITIPAGTATLRFWLDINRNSGNGEDCMTVTLDGEEVFTALESDAPEYNPWTQVAIDVSAFADGDMHVLRFESTTHGTQQVFTNFFLDEVEITVEAGGCKRDPEWQCDGDVDGDGQVNPVDSGLVQAAFGSGDEQDLCNYDVDCDGQINPVDSGIVQSLFGTCDAPREVCP